MIIAFEFNGILADVVDRLDFMLKKSGVNNTLDELFARSTEPQTTGTIEEFRKVFDILNAKGFIGSVSPHRDGIDAVYYARQRGHKVIAWLGNTYPTWMKDCPQWLKVYGNFGDEDVVVDDDFQADVLVVYDPIAALHRTVRTDTKVIIADRPSSNRIQDYDSSGQPRTFHRLDRAAPPAFIRGSEDLQKSLSRIPGW